VCSLCNDELAFIAEGTMSETMYISLINKQDDDDADADDEEEEKEEEEAEEARKSIMTSERRAREGLKTLFLVVSLLLLLLLFCSSTQDFIYVCNLYNILERARLHCIYFSYFLNKLFFFQKKKDRKESINNT
jgi:hypothetical protein